MKIRVICPMIAISLTVLVSAGFLFRTSRTRQAQAEVSSFGRYQGYRETTYDGTTSVSDYLTLANGTRLAYELILPTRKGQPASEPLPVLFRYTPYLRKYTIYDRNGQNLLGGLFPLGWLEKTVLRLRYLLSSEGRTLGQLFMTRWLGDMVKHGYAAIIVERPGTGASFGVSTNAMEAVAGEENEILNWIASNAWCDGNIGMYGDSWNAMVQFTAASTGNPHLKAILPASSQLEIYEAIEYPGGIYNKAFNSFASKAITYLENLATPVDSDKDGALLAQARRERQAAILGQTIAGAKEVPFRDSLMPDGENLWIDHMDLYPFIDRINRAGVPIYMTVGWYDVFTKDIFFWYDNLTVPKRLTVRPLDHSGAEASGFDLDYGAEARRWFDRWLKGVDNGIMNEPPIHYYAMGTPKKGAWRTTDQWPPADRKAVKFYFDEGRTGSAASANDGSLSMRVPAAKNASDAYTVDYTATSGKKSRWVSIDAQHDYSDMRANDAKALTYTTAPLEADQEVTGHPVVHLWLLTEAPDLDVFVYLEEVDGKGRSTYITEGNLRASHRKLSRAPFNNLGLPYHAHFQTDLAPIPAGEPVELLFDILPTSYKFHRGNRIRITIACADVDNFETPVLTPAPRIRLLRDAVHPSFVELPLSQAQ